ncbi:MAG TPA: ferrous iron transport protein A [Pyrinomonadaceae bacterium]|jgi:ferrous iron transport protein A|nr:ferrous iron transport protein A [Pyrinomonadaceae bacterium]
MVSQGNNFTDIDAPSPGETPPGRRAATTLDALPYGTEARVLSVDGESAVARRLMEMGVVPGAPVCVIKAAPLGDPIEVRVRGYHLALRRAEAQTIKVVTSDKGKP